MVRLIPLVLIALALGSVLGCGNGKPELYPVTGKVTYSGKAYPRLMVHFRPVSGAVTQYNLAVGETDKDGNLGIMSVHGGGIQAGEYRVTFDLYQDVRSGKTVGGSEKPDESGITAKQVIPPPYDVATSQDSTPVRFTVRPGDNVFNFDIPKK